MPYADRVFQVFWTPNVTKPYSYPARNSVIEGKRMAEQLPIMCPSWDPTRSGRPFAERSGLGRNWAFLGSIGMRTADFDPTTTRTTHPCVRDACPNHSESSCAVAEWASTLEKPEQDFDIECPLSEVCRWRTEQGPAICERCPGITHWAIEPPQGMPSGLDAVARALLKTHGPRFGPRVLEAFKAYNTVGDVDAALQILRRPVP